MTAKELMEILSKIDPNKEIVITVYDEDNDAYEVSIEKVDNNEWTTSAMIVGSITL